jgi:uncharacterized protein with von Willebrand factor type A (vWA) domain
MLHNLLLFGRVLHGLGFDSVGPARMMDVANALNTVQIGRKQDFYFTLQSLLVHRREDLTLFREAFDLFWVDPGDRIVARSAGAQETPFTRPEFAPPQLNQPPAPEQEAQDTEPHEQRVIVETTYSPSDREALKQKDFSQLTEQEARAVKTLMADMIWSPGQRRTRRLIAGRGANLNLRQTLRKNLRFGGELLLLAERKRKIKPRPLVIIADISGSMERYTRLLLQFVYSITAGLAQIVETFVFSTRLTRITRQVKQRSIERALRDVSHAVHDWAGGTRIGEAVHAFNFKWARRVMRSGAIVLIISDGWDRGEPALLAAEMARLQRNCHRLIWLNPLLGAQDYKPLARGMQAALPFVDDFLPVHNLASLEDLAKRLAQMHGRQ